MARGLRYAGAMPTLLCRRFALLAFVLVAPGCASAGGRADDARTVTVSLAESRAAALRRTLRAMREQGYHVEETLASDGVLRTEPFRHDRRTEAVFVARVTATDARARVALTGTYRERVLGVPGVLGRERAVERATEGLAGELWARLQNLALAIRSAR